MNRPVTSASNLFRRALCPGSERMEYGLPEEDSEQSREGVLLHDYAAHPEYDRTMLRPDQRDLLDRNDTLRIILNTRIRASIGYDEGKEGILTNDTRLENDLISGTPDMIVGYPEKRSVWVNDDKFGYRVVERADLNLQLRAYAILVYDFLEKEVDRCFVSITQPRLPYDERITLAMYSRQDIEASRSEIAGILKVAGKPKAKLVAGEEQCRYCKAKLICPAFQKTLTVPVLALRAKHDLDLSTTARQAYLEQQLAEVSDAQLEKIMVACAFAGFLRNPANDEARKRIAAGQMESYFLAKPSVIRDIADPQRAIALLTLSKVASREDILALCSIPLGALEEVYRKRTGCTWKEAREKIDKVLESVLERTEIKPKIVRK